MTKERVIANLKEYNDWRRGVGKYRWSDDPSKNVSLDLTPQELTETICEAIELIQS